MKLGQEEDKRGGRALWQGRGRSEDRGTNKRVVVRV